MKQNFIKAQVIVVLLMVTSAITMADPLPASEDSRSSVITIKSAILGEEVPVSIYLPADYHQSERRYPTIYILEDDLYNRAMTGVIDTRARLGSSPEMIVIGLGTPDRWRDFTPTRAGVPGQEVIPSSGGGEKHRSFLVKELIPRIEDKFRTRPFRMIFGHSIAGLHAVTTIFGEPGLFGACIATSPSLWWDGETATETAGKVLASRSESPRCIFIASGNEDETMQAPIRRFGEMLSKSAERDLRWKIASFPSADHQEVPLAAFNEALGFVFEGWALPADVSASGPEAVEAHYEGLSKRFGYKLDIPENVLNRLGYIAMNAGDLDGAISIFRRNVRTYPKSANVHDSLGEALLKKGETADALAQYFRALDLDPGNERIASIVERLSRETSPEAAACLAEVEGLHAFFREWYRGDIENSEDDFSRLAGAIAGDFTLILSNGIAVDRDQLLTMMRSEYGTKKDMVMRVQNFRFILSAADTYLMTYEEYGKAGGHEKVARITAVMRRSKKAPGGLEWVHLHESDLR